MKLKQTDSATRLLSRLTEFLAQLEKLIGLFPQYLQHDPKNTSWNDVLGFVPRYWQKAIHGTVAADRDKVQYEELKSLFTRLLEAGKKIQSALPHDEDNFEKKVQKMLALKENRALVDVMFDYFSGSATLGMIHYTIKPLMESLAYCVRITPSQDFINAFQSLIGLANARSSKVKLMLNEIDQQARSITKQEDPAMEAICQRSDTLARLSELMATFAIFSTQKPVKTQSQLMQAQKAEQMALQDGAKPEDSHEIIALRDFIELFGFDDLIPLLSQLRDWEAGKIASLQRLQDSLKTFIAFVDRHRRTKTELRLAKELYAELGQQCHLFMAGKIEESKLQETLDGIRSLVDENLLATMENSDFDSQEDDAAAPLDLIPVPPPIVRTPTMNGLFEALAADLSLDVSTLDAKLTSNAKEIHTLLSAHSQKAVVEVSQRPPLPRMGTAIDLFSALAEDLSLDSSKIHGLTGEDETDDAHQAPTDSNEHHHKPDQLRATLRDLFGEEGVYDLTDYAADDGEEGAYDLTNYADDNEVEYFPEAAVDQDNSLLFSATTSHDHSPLDPEQILKLTSVLTRVLNASNDQTYDDFDLDLEPTDHQTTAITKPVKEKDWLDLLAEQSEPSSDEETSSHGTPPTPPLWPDLPDEAVLSEKSPGIPPIVLTLVDEAISGEDPSPTPISPRVPALEDGAPDLDLEPTNTLQILQTSARFELGEEVFNAEPIGTEDTVDKPGKKKNTVLLKARFFEKAAMAVGADARKMTVPFDESAATPPPNRLTTLTRPSINKDVNSIPECKEVTTTAHPAEEKQAPAIVPRPPLDDWLDALAAQSDGDSYDEEELSSDSSNMSL